MTADPSLPISHPSQDRYAFEDYAEVLAGCILNAPDDEPLTIGIEGRWGTGKTSLVHLLEYKFKTAYRGFGQKVLIFDAWTKDQDEQGPDEFYRWLLQATYRERPPLDNLLDPPPDNLVSADERRTRGIRRSLSLLAVLLAVVAWYSGGQRFAWSSILWIVAIPLATFTFTPGVVWDLLRASVRPLGIEGLHGLGRGNSPDNIVSRQRLAELAVAEMIRVLPARSSRFVVVIDNLDRCRPKTAVEILEAVDQLVQDVPLLVVIPADFDILARQLQDEYKRRSGNDMVQEHFGKMFLERLITTPFSLPDRPLADPFVRQRLPDLQKHDVGKRTLDLEGHAFRDFRAILATRPAVFPSRHADLLPPDDEPLPGVRPPRGAGRRLAATVARLAVAVVSTAPFIFSRVARQEYPLARRPEWLGQIPIRGGTKLAHAIACLPLTVALVLLAGGAALVVGSAILGAVFLSLGTWLQFASLTEIGAAATRAIPLAALLLPAAYVLLFGGFLWVVFLASSWASGIRTADEQVVLAAIEGGSDWKAGTDNERIPQAEQLKLRELFAEIRTDPQLGSAQGIGCMELLTTERGRKRMANRARILRKIVQRRPALAAVGPSEMVAWSIAQELEARPGNADWTRIAQAVPALAASAPLLATLGMGFPSTAWPPDGGLVKAVTAEPRLIER